MNTSAFNLLGCFHEFHDCLTNPKVNFCKKGIKNIIQDYSFIHISELEKNKKEEKEEISPKIKKSTAIIIDQIEVPIK